MDHHGDGVGRLDAAHGGEDARDQGLEVGVVRPLDRELDVIRGAGVAVVELHALPELEGPRGRRGRLPLGREPGLQLAVRMAVRQVVEDVERDADVVRRGREVGIEPGEVAALGDDELALLGRLGGGAPWRRALQQGRAAAPTPRAAARSRKARRERVPVCHACTRVRNSIRSLLVSRVSGPGRPSEQLFPEAPGHEACLVAAQAMGVDEKLAPVNADHDRRLATAEGVHHAVGREPGGGIDGEEQRRGGPHAAIVFQACSHAGNLGHGLRGSGAPRRGGAPTRRRGRPGGTARCAATSPTMASLLTLQGRPTAEFGAPFAAAARMRSARPMSSPVFCGPRMPLPPLRITRSPPMSVQRLRCPTGGSVDAASTIRGQPASVSDGGHALRPDPVVRPAPATRCR